MQGAVLFVAPLVIVALFPGAPFQPFLVAPFVPKLVLVLPLVAVAAAVEVILPVVVLLSVLTG